MASNEYYLAEARKIKAALPFVAKNTTVQEIAIGLAFMAARESLMRNPPLGFIIDEMQLAIEGIA